MILGWTSPPSRCCSSPWVGHLHHLDILVALKPISEEEIEFLKPISEEEIEFLKPISEEEIEFR